MPPGEYKIGSGFGQHSLLGCTRLGPGLYNIHPRFVQGRTGRYKIGFRCVQHRPPARTTSTAGVYDIHLRW